MDRLADNTWELWLLTTCGLLVALWLVTEATVWLLMARENRRERRELDRISATWRCTECDWRVVKVTEAAALDLSDAISVDEQQRAWAADQAYELRRER